MARLLSLFDGSSSVFLGPFPKDLTLVAAGSRVGQRGGNFFTDAGSTGRWLLLRLAGRHRRGHLFPPPRPAAPGALCPSPGGGAGEWTVVAASLVPPTASLRRLVRTPVQGSRWERLVFVGEADKASDGGSPLVELLCSRREVEEQLHVCQCFRWRGLR